MERKGIKMFIPLIRTIALGYVALCLILFVFQRQFVFFPSRDIYQTPEDIGLDYDDVRLAAADGAQVHAWFVPAKPAKGAVIFCHGNAGNISHRVDTLRILHDLGYSTLIFDYHGYGESTGKPTEAATYLAAAAAWRYATEERGIDPSRVVIFGRSLGAAVAAHLASEHRPAALVLESAFNSIADMATSAYWFVPTRLLLRLKYDTAACAKAAGCPVLVLHSPDDDVVPYRLGRKLFESLPEPKEFFKMCGDHNNGFILTGQAYIDALDAFLGKHVGKPAQTAD